MSHLTVTLFGTFQATLGNQPLTRFRSDKIRALLAYLVIEADRPHRRETLAALLWPDMPDADAMRNLRKSLHRLKQTFDEQSPGFSDELLAITRQTVAVNTAVFTADTHHFQTLLHDCEQHPHRHLHTCTPCQQRLTQAADLYKGELLTGFTLPDAPTFDEWLIIQRESLHHNILLVLDHLTRAAEANGRYPQAQRYASRQIALEPWREEAHRQLMRAFAANGQRAEALAQYDTCAQILEEELGVEPAPETADLRQQITDNRLTIGPAPARPLLHHFPTQLTPFIGRHTELDQITSQLSQPDCRLLTLIGPGGMGKTRLSSEAAKRLADGPHFADGLYFVGLTAVTHPTHLVAAIAHSLGLTFDERADPQTQLSQFLTTKQTLLVLDNCEHLLAADGSDDAATIISDLLTAVPHLKLLITSREALNLRAEHRFRLDGLTFPTTDSATDLTAYSAIQLFTQTARQMQPGFVLAEAGPTAVSHICQLVQGVPLAIEMAASWVRLMDCATIAQEIQRNLDFLTTSLRDVPQRHRSMRAVFAESWRLLPPGEQRTLAQAAYFRGGFDLQTALQIIDTSIGDLTSLLDKSLLRRGVGSRYTLHELLRQFALEKLGEAGETAVARRHSQFYLHHLARLGPQLHGENSRQTRTTIQADLDNIRQAWQWALSHSQYEWLTPAIQPLAAYFRLAGLTAEGEAAMAAASQAVPLSQPLVLSQLQVQQANFLSVQGHYEQAMTAVQSALSLAQAQNNAAHIALAQNTLGEIYERQGEYEAALAQWQQALAYWETAGNPLAHIKALDGLSLIYFHKGEYDRALRYHERSLHLAQQQHSHLHIANSFTRLGLIHQHRGDFGQAESFYKQALAIEEAMDDQFGIANTCSTLGVLHYKQGDYDTAIAYLRRALHINRQLGQKERIAAVLGNMGNVYFDQANYDDSLRSQREALQLDYELGNKRGIIIRSNNVGLNLWRKGRYEEALETYDGVLGMAREMGFKLAISILVGNKGVVQSLQGDYAAALASFAEALQVDRELGNKEGEGRHLSNIGGIYREMGALDKALAHLVLAIPIQRQLSAKFHLCEALLRQGQTLLDMGRLAEVAAPLAEATAVARDINRQDTLFSCELLQAQVWAAQGDETAAHDHLQRLWGQTAAVAERASLAFELWCLTKETGWRETAVALYHQLYQTTPNILYQTRLTELKP
ncbi:MAG: tetratricopeptide repeat protein [Ardenticatenaceae bacterium]|nr:tetratricopeptide repeat protein [Ardenticatenaceae bacterium]